MNDFIKNFFALLIILTVPLMFIAACSNDPPPDNTPQLVTTAPDGTQLWAVDTYNGVVYFSTSGTTYKHSYSCGKHTCYSTESTPNNPKGNTND